MTPREAWQALTIARAEAERLRLRTVQAKPNASRPAIARAKAMHEEALRAVDLAIEGVCE